MGHKTSYQENAEKNPEYEYHFYDDDKILEFFAEEFPPEYLEAYKRLTIGAAKADFFRYAVLYKKGGVYLDIDSGVKSPFRNFIREDDEAIITNEGNPGLYVQWALIFNKEHPFLKRTLEMVLDNIQTHRYPHDVHATTGPAAYTKAVNECIAENPHIPHRFLGTDFEGHLQFKYKLGKFFFTKRKQNTGKINKKHKI
ncbi:glycosyltransferase family 32 protein [Paludibacter sp. 221]|uniref:glycosyltransferase family 32 protein n=1 Tax=Paludibacter sp. 221 TaxID=2302939 RepID=UPI001942DCC9|nr:glycosyltransferase [Paludibacter sp. 221]